MFQQSHGDLLDRSVTNKTSPAELDVMMERLAAILTSKPLTTTAPIVINYTGTGAAIVINADTNATAKAVQIVRKNGEQATFGVGLESSGIIANQLVNRDLFRVPSNVAQQKIRRALTKEDDPGTGYGREGYGTGKLADEKGVMSVVPNATYPNEFIDEHNNLAMNHFFAEGLLTTDLAVATNGLTGATTATMQTWVRDEASVGNLKNGDVITVTNRDTSFSLASGKYLQVIKLQATEWRPYWGAC